MSKQSLLLVDGDPRSLRVLEVSLKKAGFNVTTAINGTDALEKIALALPDLILSETKLDGVDGFDLCQRLKANTAWSAIPFVFLTAQTEIEHKIKGLELGCDDYLTKPIYIKEIVTRVRILLQKQQRTRIEQKREGRTRFTGRLSDMAVVDLIQTIELSRKSGVIQFHGEPSEDSAGPTAAIYFRDGKVIDAELGGLQGEDAVYRLLTWNDGEFEVAFRTVRRRDVIEMTTQALLMEGMRRLDEWGRLLEQLPNLQARFEVDVKELAARLGDIPDEHNAILKLFDGRRTLMEVIDASGFGDLETLEVIAKLYFEGLLFEVSPPPARTKAPTEEWFPAKLLEATPTDPGQVDAIPTEVTGEEPSGATAPRLAEGKAADVAKALDARPLDEPSIGGPPTSLIFDETFQGEDATPLPGPMIEAIDEGSGPTSVIESLGADTATAHGELDSGQFDLRQLTQRELVTIPPRRARSEGQAIDASGDDDFTEVSERVTGEIALPALVKEEEKPDVIEEKPAPRTMPPRPPPRRAVEPVSTAPPVPPPSRNAYLIAAIAGLVGLFILWRALRSSDNDARSEDLHTAAVAPDARPAHHVTPPSDAAPPAHVAVDARPVTIDAGVVPAIAVDAAPVDEKKKQARDLLRKAQNALDDVDYAGAVALADQSLALRKSSEAFEVKADALRREGKADDALAVLETALAARPRDPSLWRLKGNILWGAGRRLDAKAAYQQYLQLAPNAPDADRIRQQVLEE